LVLAAVIHGSACMSRPPTLQPDSRATLFVRDASLDTERIQVHLVRAAGAGDGRPLLLYATGDGGWRSADRGLFQHLARWGYPVAGFSARHYLEHLGFEATTPAHVAEDYGRLIAFAKRELELPADTATVLVGFSRGSGLAVVAAGQSELRPVLGGLLAVALDDEEEYVHKVSAPGVRPRSDRLLASMRPYDVLKSLDGLPLAVIQSTQDGYLKAADARRLFGPDGEWRRFYSVEARNHTFADAREALYEQARVALEWIVSPRP
jgi:hypothetical protein